MLSGLSKKQKMVLFLKADLIGKIQLICEETAKQLQKLTNFRGKYEFINRQKGSENLVVILAGYQPYYWDIVFAALKKFVPHNYDIVIASGGRDSEQPREIAQTND
jgi:Trk K+ transport system NAD-binding subunit